VGPGHTDLIQGLYDAHRSGVPVLAIASPIATEQFGIFQLPAANRSASASA
jgi:pyruvate dehydrogenase (quinone)